MRVVAFARLGSSVALVIGILYVALLWWPVGHHSTSRALGCALFPIVNTARSTCQPQ